MYNFINSGSKLPFTRRDKIFWKPTVKGVIHNSILDLIGNTPLVKLNKIPKAYNLECEIYAKCEFLNPGGSIKDRTALAMLKDAKQGGKVTDKTIFVEPTSGNTGIGVAFEAALMDNKSIIITGEKNSNEKVSTMRLLGAEVIQTNKSSIEIAHKIHDKDLQNVVILNQFENHANPRVHYETTGEEILNAMGEINMVVMGTGTGGTLSGVGHKIKERYPNCHIIAAEPDGSTIFNVHGKKHSYLVEGIGGSKAPIVLDKSVANGYEVVSDEESFLMARELSQKEGLLCGGSSGAAMAAAIKAAKRLKLGLGKRIVVLLIDGIRNYMTKFVCNQWMEAHLFLDPPEHTMSWWKDPITKLTPGHEYPKLDSKMTCLRAIKEMGKGNMAVVVNEKGSFVGAVSKDAFRNYATNPTRLPYEDSENLDFNEPVTNYLVKHCHILAKNGKKGMPSIGLLSRILDITDFVVIGTNVSKDDEDHFIPESIATADDILNYILVKQ
ncbi:unnamed protein product [Pieris brassicae]|uniref:Tryptophan synthase beta chain-like PALP domain-containing protein n=1 Tax=Pieris brassicae TaxID=7116 RepID=A0A9P0TL36_PIEBR|nr:unnamed protein product [Pieris brassicae]